MNEEIRNPKAELNEAELKSVSGGMSNDFAGQLAQSNCVVCDRRNLCGPRVMDLKKYLLENDITIDYWGNCPFYNEAGRA